MLKNILVTANYTIKGEIYGNAKTEDYTEITELCINSFKKNLVDLDDVIILKGEVDNYHQVFKNIYREIYNIYHAQECNILWVDSDSVCVKRTRVFGLFLYFVMFSIIEQFRTAFPDNVPVELYNHLSPWYMSNVRYYPCGLKDKVWDKGDELFKKWIDVWAYECIVYNAMMHSQDIFYIKEGKKCGFSFPKLNYQYMLGQEHLNGIALQEAHIIHCQATRGSKEAINKMKALIEE